MNQNEDKKRKIIAIFTSVTIHALILLFFLFMVIRTPNPPMGGGDGIVLNLGFVDEGSGEFQSIEPDQPTATPQPQATTSTPESENGKTDAENNLTSEVDETDVAVETGNKTKGKTEVTQTPVVDTKIETKPNQNTQVSTQTNTTNTTTKTSSDGDKIGKTGNQGDPNGSVDSRAYYGKQGTGGNGNGTGTGTGSGPGSSLDLAGWAWDEIPKVRDNEDDNGRIVFQITINNEGEIVGVKLLESTVSATAVKQYRDRVEKLTFSKTDNKPAASSSVGRITFVIRSR